MSYKLTWITKQLAVGHAPMSYDELDSIKEQGIGAIVNLCAEFSDLHEIEEQAGFEVYYLPVHDECAPELEAMEKALHWFDESIYLKKKILVHCRHGIGRTGTFVSAYLLRRGLGFKLAEKTLKATRATPTNHSQWKLLKRYGKQQGMLTTQEASIHDKNTVDLTPFFIEYQAILAEFTSQTDAKDSCWIKDKQCCHEYFELQLVEAVFVSHSMNLSLTSSARENIIHTALSQAQKHKKNNTFLTCPLLRDDCCQIAGERPLHCRNLKKSHDKTEIDSMIETLSRDVFFSLTGSFPPEKKLYFSMLDTISGRFVQHYFQAMLQISSK
jgi:protein tyrosine phosphatase (PTP) superfamily phosphohydrolase (DUF442 family)/Fe-S-cluster containining protein